MTERERPTSPSKAIGCTHPRPRDVMAGLVPAIRDKPGHDGHSVSRRANPIALEGSVYRGGRR